MDYVLAIGRLGSAFWYVRKQIFSRVGMRFGLRLGEGRDLWLMIYELYQRSGNSRASLELNTGCKT